MKLKFYSDPGHGWLAVKRDVISGLGLEGQISIYSYQRGKTVYLEEDCDAPLVLNALRQRGDEFSITNGYTDKRSPIRSYNIYQVSKSNIEV